MDLLEIIVPTTTLSFAIGTFFGMNLEYFCIKKEETR